MRIITLNNDNTVVMYSEDGKPVAGDNQTAYDLSDEQKEIFVSILRQPNGGIVFDGQTFTALPPPPPLPLIATCTPWQFRTELRIRGIKEEVEALVAASPPAVQDAYEYATSYESNNAMLLQLAALLSTPLSEQDVYDMISAASTRQIGQQ